MMDELATLKVLLGDDAPSDNELSVYLSLARTEILNWLYHNFANGCPESVVLVPPKYEVTMIYAVVAGYNIKGAENQSVSIENGIHRHFEYADMVAYIRANVIPYARVS